MLTMLLLLLGVEVCVYFLVEPQLKSGQVHCLPPHKGSSWSTPVRVPSSKSILRRWPGLVLRAQWIKQKASERRRQ